MSTEFNGESSEYSGTVRNAKAFSIQCWGTTDEIRRAAFEAWAKEQGEGNAEPA